MKDVAVAYEHSGYEPDEITHTDGYNFVSIVDPTGGRNHSRAYSRQYQLYPDLSLGDVHRALAYYYDNIDDFRSTESATA